MRKTNQFNNMTTFRRSLILLSCFALAKATATSTGDSDLVGGGLDKLLQNEFLIEQNNAQVSFDSSSSDSCAKYALYKYMDNLAIKLSNAISNRSSGPQMLSELQEAINMVDMLKASSSASKMVSVEAKLVKYNNFQAPSRGLLDVLSDNKEASNKEHIVHSKKKLSDEALKELEQFANSGSISAEKFIQFYSDPKWNRLGRTSSPRSEKIQAVKDFLINGFNNGANLFDQLYLSTGFIEQLPIIGNEITKLKQKGQAVYDLIRTVRSLKTFMDIYKSGQEFNVKFTEEGNKMLGKAGFDALKYVAAKMLKSYTGLETNPGNINEIAGRTAYYLLIQFAPHFNQVNCSKN